MGHPVCNGFVLARNQMFIPKKGLYQTVCIKGHYQKQPSWATMWLTQVFREKHTREIQMKVVNLSEETKRVFNRIYFNRLFLVATWYLFDFIYYIKFLVPSKFIYLGPNWQIIREAGMYMKVIFAFNRRNVFPTIT